MEKTKENGRIVKAARYTYAGSRLNQTIEGDSHFYLYDSPSRNVSGLISKKGTLTSSYDYSAYGASLEENAGNNPFRFCGELLDQETGLIYLKNRYYDPDLGRFISEDRVLGMLEHPETLNPYAYVNNNPINFIDPLGFDAVCPEKWEKVVLHINDMGGWFGGQGAGGHVFLEFSERDLFFGNYPEGVKWNELKNINRNTTSFECLCPSSKVSEAIAVMREITWTRSKNCVYTAVEGMKIMGFAHADKIELDKGCPLPSELRSQMLKFTGNSSHLADYPRRIVIECQPPQGGPLAAAMNLDYGGVSLSKSAEFDTPLTDIIGATVDPNTGQLILFGSSDLSLPPFDLDDLAVAIKSVYGLSQKPPEDPGVSIGTEPSPIPGQMTVRYDGATFGTAFGNVMFEADRLLKCLTLGQDNITGEPFHANVPGYISLHDRLAMENFVGDLINRMWFVPEKVSLALSEDGKSLLFSDVKIQLLTESQFTGAGKDPEACIEFAEHFNAHFEEFAREFPILEQLKTLGKVTAIVKWLKEEKIPFDTKLFAAHEPNFCFTPDMTPATKRITEEETLVRLRPHKKSKYLKHVHSHPIKSLKTVGGIVYHLGEHNFSSHEHPMAREFAYSALEARPEEHSSAWNFSCPHAKGELTALSEALYHTKKPGNIRKSFVDMQLPMPGDIPLTLTRFYNSFYENTSGFGFGWRIAPYELELPAHKIEIEVTGKLFSVYPALLLRSPEGEELYTLAALDLDGSFLFCNRSQSTWIREMSSGPFLLEDKNTKISFNELGQILTLKDAQGLGISYRYENGLLIAISHGEETIFLDYEEDRILSARGPHGLVVYYQYNEEKLLCGSITAKDKFSYAYEDSKRLSHIFDSTGHVVFEANYDPYHRATYMKETGNSYSTDFSLAQRTMRTKNAFGQETLLRFDEDNRLMFKQEPSGRTWEFVYEQSLISQPTKIIENHAFVTECRYDAFSRLVYLKNPQGGIWRFFYDGDGNLLAESFPNGNAFLHFYDALHRKIQSFLKVNLTFDKEDPVSPLKGFNIEGGHALTYTYDPATGNLASFTNTRGGTTTFTYNKSGQLQEITSPTGQTQLTEWDYLGNLRSAQACGMMQTSISYEQDLPKTINTHFGTIELQYDDNRNLTQIVEPDGADTRYRHDCNHNLIEVIDAEGGVTRFTYNAEQQLTYLYLPNGSIKKLEYDELGRIRQELWVDTP
jgi:RHS repeat-associated protein